MKVDILCPACRSEFSGTVPPKNHCVYEFSCDCGYYFSANILYHEFQKLFEIAVSALNDEYFRESISSFTASYERFMELFIRCVMNANQIESHVLESNWKTVSRQSERQLGAFIFLYGLQFNSVPVLLNNKLVELRNKVIHQGYFPDRDECLSFGTAVMDFMYATLEEIYKHEVIWNELVRSINDQGDWSENGPQVHYYAYSLIGTNRAPAKDPRSLEEILSQENSKENYTGPIRLR